MSFESMLPKEAIQKMENVFEGMTPVISEKELTSLCEDSETLKKLLEGMLEYAVRYAQDVWNMEKFILDGGLATKEGAEQFAEIDAARSRLHNALIDSIGILSRELNHAGKDNEWVRKLTNGVNLERSKCGAFALLLVYRRYIDTL